MVSMTGSNDAGEEQLSMQIDGFYVGALLHTAAKLSLADYMGSIPLTAEQLAETMGLSPTHLLRFLRALSTIGICEERPDRGFLLTRTGQALKSGSPSGLREKAIIACEQYWEPWANLDHSLRTGGTAFDKIHGMNVWDWRRVNKSQGAMFQAWATTMSAAQAEAILRSIDFGDATKIADLGGGSGSFLAHILQTHPNMTGVLFDKRQTLAEAKRLLQRCEVAERVECVDGDLLQPFNVVAHVYLLKNVLHDWEDMESRTILQNCRDAMPDNAKLIIIENMLPQCAAEDPAAIMLDMHMMVVTGGRERSLEQFKSLLLQSGFEFLRAEPTSARLWVIEASCA